MDGLIVSIIETVAIIAFAISGSTVAIDNGMDLFGVVFLGMTTCFGGGIMRDVILGRMPLFFTSMWLHVTVAFAVSLLTFLAALVFRRGYKKNEERVLSVINYIDALGIGAFTVSGVKMCIESFSEYGALLAVFMGALTAVGGGMIRDICLRTVPFILRKRIYVLASLAGGVIYYFLTVSFEKSIFTEVLFSFIGISVVFIIRVLATVFKWNLPRAVRTDCGEDSATEEEKKKMNV